MKSVIDTIYLGGKQQLFKRREKGKEMVFSISLQQNI